METLDSSNDKIKATHGGGVLLWAGLAILVPAAAVFGAGVGWLAVWVQAFFSPLIVFPLLLGAGLGLLVVLTVRTVVMADIQFGHRPTIVAAAVTAALTAIAAQHYLAYRTERRLAELQAEQIKQEAAAVFGPTIAQYIPQPPENVFVFLQNNARKGRDLNVFGWVARGWQAWLSWAVDGLLLLAATLAVVVPVTWLPYCNRCRSWYRETRNGQVDGRRARRLVEALGETAATGGLSVGCRLLNCRGGCGATACILSWRPPQGRPKTVRGWLDAPARDQITQLLDRTTKRATKS